jgi:SAM-dependent methyltransferase
MYESALGLLRCPVSGSALELSSTERDGDDVRSGELRCTSTGRSYPIVNGIPRFVPPENYAESFEFQWDLYGSLQVDRLHDHSLTRERFYSELGCGPEDLAGLRVLEAGCGGGRFSDLVLEAGGELYAADLSNAVEKNRELHPGNPHLHLVQAAITELPFAPDSFDLVFCFGVLQHTPSPRATFRALVPFVKPRGRLAVDIYAAHPKQTSHWKYLVRPVTKRLGKRRLHRIIERSVPVLLPISRSVRRIPKIGKLLSRFVPIKVHDGFMGRVSPEEEERWAVLETLDALSPAYDKPRSRRTLHRWFEECGLTQVETFSTSGALNYGRGTKPG